jgi:hypothetical protein
MYVDASEPVGLFIVTHGAPDGVPPDDWFDTGGARFQPLQHDLARSQILSAFVRDSLGSQGMIAAVDAIKLYIASMAAESPDGPLAAIDIEAMQIAFGGHSQGGATAFEAARVSGGIPVRAVVGLASGDLGDEQDPIELHPGTWYLGLVGTHDGSPSVTNRAPVRLFEQIVTDRPKILILARGVNHGQLGPGSGSLANVPGAYMLETQFLGESEPLAIRSFVVRSFLEWALLGDDASGRFLALEPATTMAWAEDLDGGPTWAECGPSQTPVLSRFPAAEPPLAPYTCRLVYDGGSLDGVQAMTNGVASLEMRDLQDPLLGMAADVDINDCEGVTIPSPAPSSGHTGELLLVQWDLKESGASSAILRFDLPEPLGSYVAGLQPPETYSVFLEIGLRVNSSTNASAIPFGYVKWRPAIGLGTSVEPQLWVRPQPVLYGFGYACPLLFENDSVDQRRTTLTSVSANVALLLPDGTNDVTHLFVDLAWPAFEVGECCIRRVSVVYHG